MLSRADRGAFVREPVDLSLVAEEAVELLLPLAEARGVVVEASGVVAVAAGSHALLLQLATNLAHNGIVHNLPTGGTVLVTTETRDHSVVLRVENTGRLLSAERIATLTEPFQRGAERIRSDHAGAGLGLAIAKSIVRAHDGEITLAPRADGGLIVTVRFAAA
jgi:two-component system sensor histidine kinase VanS